MRHHTIEFMGTYAMDLLPADGSPAVRTEVAAGTLFLCGLWSYVVETAEGPCEVADLAFADGSVSYMVRWECFRVFECGPIGGIDDGC